MKQSSLIFIVLFFFACQEKKQEKDAKDSKANIPTEELDVTEIPDIEGTYIYEYERDSTENAVLTITEKNKTFFYNLKTNARNVNGKISIAETDGDTYLTLEGIKWAEYRGDISKEMDSNTEVEEDSIPKNKDEIEIPVGIEVYLSSDELIIQNGGNAMNYYVVLGECSEKYLHFRRQ